MTRDPIHSREWHEPSALLEAAKSCLPAAEYWQAYSHCVQALRRVTPDSPPQLTAEIRRLIGSCQRELSEHADDLPHLLDYLRSNPDDGEARFCLGFTFHCFGDGERAITEYRKALEQFDSMDPEEQRDCLNNVGWYFYRRGEFQTALGWFERACWHQGNSEPGPYRLAMENRLLVYVELGMVEEARRVAEEYIDLYGPIPTTEAHALLRLGLDADSIWLKRVMGIA